MKTGAPSLRFRVAESPRHRSPNLIVGREVTQSLACLYMLFLEGKTLALSRVQLLGPDGSFEIWE